MYSQSMTVSTKGLRVVRGKSWQKRPLWTLCRWFTGGGKNMKIATGTVITRVLLVVVIG